MKSVLTHSLLILAFTIGIAGALLYTKATTPTG
jgi:hypothetical protein